MTTAFPGAIDAFTNPTATDALDSATVPHASQHANINDAVEAVETYLLAQNFGFTSGLYYRGINGLSNNATPILNQTVFLPFAINKTQTFDRIAIQTGTSYVGTGAVRLGIYNNDSATGKPSTVVLDAGTVATTAATTIYEITISQSLSAGAYWIAFNMQTAPATPRFQGGSTAVDNAMGYFVSTTGIVSTGNAGAWTEASISGAFATAGTLVSATSGGTCVLRAS